MKSILAAVSLALASTAMPAVVVAQDRASEQTSETTIVVTAEHQRDWNRGQRLESRGLQDLAKAERDLARYNDELADAQSARNAAQARVDSSRSEFESLVARASTVTNPDRARDFGQDIRRFAEEWEDSDDQVRSAEKDLERATDRQLRAQEAYDNAQAMIERGRMMMVEAERLSRARPN